MDITEGKTVKIDNSYTNNVISAYRNESPTSTKGDAGQKTDKTKAGQPDQVVLSTRKSEIEKLRKTAEAMPNVRSEKVAALRQRISEGTYKVDGVRVAEKMLSDYKSAVGKGGSKWAAE